MNIDSKKMPIGNPQESGVSSSRAAVSAQRFLETLKRKNTDMESLDKTEEGIRQVLTVNSRALMPGVTIDDVITELKSSGFIVAPKKQETAPEPEKIFRTEYQKATIVHDEELKKLFEENMLLENMEEVFKNDTDLDHVYEKSLSLGKENNPESIESEEYYLQFAHLVQGGEEEIKNDLESLRLRQEQFRAKTEAMETSQGKRTEKAKKIATIVERSVVYSVSSLGWYGESVSIEPASQFDDVKRGVDDVLEIQKEGESSFMGLGIDVTYRGLLSKQFQEKFSNLLKTIRDGHRTKIKYFKNHHGDPMREFSVPKVILFFDMKDVKDLVHMVKNAGNPEIMETYKNSPQKFKVMNQILIQCEILAQVAEEYQNPIFKKYQEMVATIKELSWKNPEIKSIIDSSQEDDVAKHMKYLIEEFKTKNPN